MKYRNDMFDLTMILAIMLMAIFALLCYVYTFTSIGSFIGCVLSVIVPISVMIQLIDSMDEEPIKLRRSRSNQASFSLYRFKMEFARFTEPIMER